MQQPTRTEVLAKAQDDADIARDLVREGWMSTSNKSRNVARLPAGLTGMQALARRAPLEHARLTERLEREAANIYRRMYASENDGTRQTLDSDMFTAFKRSGGEASW